MNERQLIDVAAAIADGLPVDWAAFASAAPPLFDELALPARIVERIAQVHADLPSIDTFSSSLHTSLAGIRLPGDATAPPETPVTWGTLTIVEKIGRGTFGDVYRAHDRRLNRTVALKLLRRKDRLESAVIEEGQLMARVRHPHVVTVYGAERIEARVGLWMQFVDGQTLEDQLKSRGPFTPQEVAEAGIQLAQALAAVHRAGLLHRDVKAQNAMRDADGRVLLTDFGTGRELSETSVAGGGRELAGTPLYMAPEVLDGAPASASSDLYSLGVLLYHLATGSFPVKGRSLRELREAHQQNRRTLVRATRTGVPKRLAAVIDRATDPDPTRRYASASDLEAALLSSSRPRTHRAAWVAAAAVALVVATVLVTWQWRRPFAVAPAAYQVRDSVLVSRFDNSTGHSMFDGGIEYAIARELSRSDIIDVVPAERVIDALRLMKRPVETIVDRTVGHEVSLRDGRVKAFVTGRIEKTSRGYRITAELVDPADGAVVASVADTAATTAAVLPTITREAHRLREAFGELRARIKGAPRVQQVSTASLAALQLHSEAVRVYWSNAGAEEAEPINRRALAHDPDFAAAWMLQAYLLGQMKGPGAEGRESQARAAAERGLALADTVPDWERHFLRGVHRYVLGDYAGSLPEFDAAVRLRPDFEPAARYMTNTHLALGRPEAAVAGRKSVADQRPFDIAANFQAAYTILRLREDPDEARPYINRLNELLVPERSGMPLFYMAAQWRRMLPAYVAWMSGDIAGAQVIVDGEARQIHQWPAERAQMQGYLASFYMTLGRLHDAERHLLDGGHPDELLTLAEIRGDMTTLQEHLLRLPPDINVYRLVQAGLIDQARARLESPASDPLDRQIENIGRAALASATGSPETAIPLLRNVLALGGHLSAFYQISCDLLSTALVRVNRRAESIAELERCVTVAPRFFGRFNAGYRMKNQMRLADEYRATGRPSDAERIEEQLRGLLVYADADHPLVVRLRQARGR
jgi:tetratricopeptide (TPR) repeat protein